MKMQVRINHGGAQSHTQELEFIMEAHNGMSAKIAQEAGFKGIWASGN
jgi:2-methylisocitrate lyase-like PEP mutase family enzyme